MMVELWNNPPRHDAEKVAIRRGQSMGENGGPAVGENAANRFGHHRCRSRVRFEGFEIFPVGNAKRRKRLSREFDKYRTRDSMQALTKLTSSVDGTPQIVGAPPLIVPIRDLVPAAELDNPRRRFSALIRQYRRTLLFQQRGFSAAQIRARLQVLELL